MSLEKKHIQAIVLLVVLVLVIILAVNFFKNKDGNKGENVSQQSAQSSGIDLNDADFKDKKIYEENGKIIIEDSDGSKTIETIKSTNNSKMKETTADEKEKYTLSDVNVAKKGNSTIITGNVANNDGKDHELIVNVKFYSDENKIVGSGSKKIAVKSKANQAFSIKIMDDVSSFRYDIKVEYAD